MIRENLFKHDVYTKKMRHHWSKKWNIKMHHFHFDEGPGDLRVEIVQTQ